MGSEKEKGEKRGGLWPVSHLQEGRRVHGTHEGRVCLF